MSRSDGVICLLVVPVVVALGCGDGGDPAGPGTPPSTNTGTDGGHETGDAAALPSPDASLDATAGGRSCRNDEDCDDGLFCNGEETCVDASCVPGSDSCPDRRCDEGNELCVDCLGDEDCDDGLFCNGKEACVDGSCVRGSDSCPDRRCDEGNELCVDCLGDEDCDDGLFCNGEEACEGGSCQSGGEVECDDHVSCTQDACDEEADACDNTPTDASCDNGLFCDGEEVCDAEAGCQPGTPPDCQDAVSCTDDSCVESTDTCAHSANDANCDSGYYCDSETGCSDIDECSQQTHDCDEHARCVNTEPGFDCECLDGYTGDGRDCHCPLSGYWAMRQDVTITWPAVVILEVETIRAGSLDTTAWELHYWNYDGSTLEMWGKGCGQHDAPDLFSPPFNEVYSYYTPLATSDPLPLERGADVPLANAIPGSEVTTPDMAAVLGLVLDDPLNDPWPASRDAVAEWSDPDGDGQDGLTLWHRGTTEVTDEYPSYTYSYTILESGGRAGCFSTAVRAKYHIRMALDSCSAITGDVVTVSSEARFHSCTKVPDTDWNTVDVTCNAADWQYAEENGLLCSASDLNVLDAQQADQEVVTTPFELVWLGAGEGPFDPANPEFSCPDVRAMLPPIPRP